MFMYVDIELNTQNIDVIQIQLTLTVSLYVNNLFIEELS